MRKITIPFLVITIFFLIAPFQHSYAEDTYIIIKNQGEIQEQISMLMERLESLNHEFKELKEHESKLEQELIQSNQILQEKTDARDRSLSIIRELTTKIDHLDKEYKNSLERSLQRSVILRDRLIAMQERNTPLEYLTILIDSKNLNDLLNRFTAMVTFLGADQELLEQSLSEQEELLEKQLALENTKEKLDIENQNLQSQISEIEAEKQNQLMLLSQIRERQQKVLQEQENATQKNKELLKEQQKLNQQLSYNSHTYSVDMSKGVPVEYLPYYISSGQKYGVDWEILAAIHKIETNFSNHPTMISSAFAIGHMQFLELTWVGYKYDNGNGRPSPDLDITSLDVIKQGGGYGKDADGDGKADPFNLADAIESAASYLAKNGYSTNPAKAIWHYNHAQWYVDKVLKEAQQIKGLNLLAGQ